MRATFRAVIVRSIELVPLCCTFVERLRLTFVCLDQMKRHQKTHGVTISSNTESSSSWDVRGVCSILNEIISKLSCPICASMHMADFSPFRLELKASRPSCTGSWVVIPSEFEAGHRSIEGCHWHSKYEHLHRLSRTGLGRAGYSFFSLGMICKILRGRDEKCDATLSECLMYDTESTLLY